MAHWNRCNSLHPHGMVPWCIGATSTDFGLRTVDKVRRSSVLQKPGDFSLCIVEIDRDLPYGGEGANCWERHRFEISSVTVSHPAENGLTAKTIHEDCLHLCGPSTHETRIDARAMEQVVASLTLYICPDSLADASIQLLLEASLLCKTVVIIPKQVCRCSGAYMDYGSLPISSPT